MRLLPRLIDHAYENGYEVVGGELKRDQRIADLNAAAGVGISKSLHLASLAIDLSLFKDGQYLDQTFDYAGLGAYWKSLDPLCRWGGDFVSLPDGGHFSLEWEGRR